MFNFLKNKLKSVVENFSRKAEEDEGKKKAETAVPEAGKEAAASEIKAAVLEVKEEAPVKEAEVKKGAAAPAERAVPSTFESAIEEVKADLRKKAAELEEEERLKKEKKGFLEKVASAFKKKPQEKAEEKKGIIERLSESVTTTRISEEKFESLFEDMDLILLENNVAVEVIDKIRSDLKAAVVGKPIPRGKVESEVTRSLKASIESLFDVEKMDLMKKVREKKPYIILFAGINGSGKTTTIAKVSRLLQDSGLKCVIAASDTFRAAAIHQLQEHADRLGVKLVKQEYGADPAAVAFDAIKYAESKGADAVLIDTAGRQHSNKNLVEEMKKIVRVAKPDLKIFVGEAITGNDCVEQAKTFNEAIGIDAIILAKADVDEKGGAAISVSYVTKKPVIYIGTGQDYGDLAPFNPAMVVESLGLSD